MKTFFLGAMVGSILTGTLAGAGNLYDRAGNPAAPRGSVQQSDYFRQRGQQLDIEHLRKQADQDRLNQAAKPCAK